MTAQEESGMMFTNDDIAEMIYDRLVKMGYAVSEEETLDLADVFFDMLLDLGIMRELDDLF